jgi:hypothetical protein
VNEISLKIFTDAGLRLKVTSFPVTKGDIIPLSSTRLNPVGSAKSYFMQIIKLAKNYFLN